MPSQTLDLIYKWWYFYDLYKKSVAPPPHAQQQNAPQLPFIHHKSYYQPLEVRQSRPTQREPMLLNRPRPASPIKKITRPKSRSPLKSRSKSPEKRPMAPSLKPSDFQHTSPPHQLYDNLYTGQSPVPVNPVPGNLYETETQSPFSSSPNLAATKIHHLVDYLDSDGPQFPDDFGTYRVDWEPDVKARSRTTSIGDVKIEDIEDDDERDYTSDEAEPDILKQKKSMTVLKNSPKHANIENLDDSPKLKAVFGVNGSNFGDTLNEDMTVLNFTVPEVQLPELRSLNDEDIRLLEKSKIIEPTASLDEMHLESIGSVVAAEGDFVEGDLEEEEDDELEGLVEDLINALKSENYGK